MLWFLQMPHAAQMPEMNPPRQPTAAMRVPTPVVTNMAVVSSTHFCVAPGKADLKTSTTNAA